MIAVEFLPLADRRFVTVSVDLIEQDSPDGRADSQSAERGLARLHADGGSGAQAPGLGARFPGPALQGTDGMGDVTDALDGERFADPLQTAGSVSRSGQSALIPSGALDETDVIAAAIEEQLPLQDAVLRVQVRATDEQRGRVDEPALHRLIADAGVHKLAGGIAFEIVRPQRARVADFDAGLGEHEALDAWCDAQEATAFETGMIDRRGLHEFLTRSREASAATDAGAGGVLEPVSLTARNVGRFHELHVEFTEGATALVGANGAGKSAVLRCVELALYAKGPDLRRELAPWADDLEILFAFDLDGGRHRVRRTFRRKDRRAAFDFEQHVYSGADGPSDTPGGWRTLNRETAAATQAALDAALGMDRELSALSWMLMQGNASAFLDAAPADRKAALAKPLDPERIYPTAVTLAKAEAKQTAAEIDSAATQIAERQHRLAALPAVNEKVALLEVAAAEGQSAVAAAEASLEQAQAALAGNAAAAERVRTLTVQRDHAKAALEQACAALAGARQAAEQLPETQSRLAALSAQAARVPELEAKLDEQRRAMDARTAAISERDTLQRRAADAHRRRVENEADRARRAGEIDAMRAKGEMVCPVCTSVLVSEEKQQAALESLAGQMAVIDEVIARIAAEEQEAERAAAAIVIPTVEQGTFGLDLQAARTAERELPAVALKVQMLNEQSGTLSGAEATVMHASAALAEADVDLAAATVGVADEQLLRQAVAETRAALTARRGTLDATAAELTRARQTVEQLQAAEHEIAQLVDETAKTRERLDLLRLAERAFGRDGIPVLLVETVLAQFEADANAVLRRFPTADGQTFAVRFETQREQVTTDTLREELYVIVSAPDYEQEFETLSGGEESRVSFAVRYALSQMLGRLRGARSRLLVLDELPFLDAAGEEALVVLVREAIEAGDFSFVVLVSHSPNVRDALDNVVEISKADGVSRIVGDGRAEIAA